jgi:uncharacterized protein YgiM (DUF1202 family)
MKALLVSLLVLSAIPTGEALSHSGGLRRDGCHMDHSIGEVHCHRPSFRRQRPTYSPEIRGRACVNGSDVNVRSAPELGARVISVLQRNQCVRLSELMTTRVDGYRWALVVLSDGRTGWVADVYLNVI